MLKKELELSQKRNGVKERNKRNGEKERKKRGKEAEAKNWSSL